MAKKWNLIVDVARCDNCRLCFLAVKDEYIGNDILKLAIQFKEPEMFGLARSKFAAAGVQTAICAHVGPAKAPINVGKLVHLIRATPDGCEMRSRFWLGPTVGPAWVRRLLSPKNLGRDMVVHCALEMNHLARFLPELHAQYHPN